MTKRGRPRTREPFTVLQIIVPEEWGTLIREHAKRNQSDVNKQLRPQIERFVEAIKVLEKAA